MLAKVRKYNCKKLPNYAYIAFDLYTTNLNRDVVAKKHCCSKRQIRYILAKSIKSNLPNMWKQIHTKQIRQVPFYIQVAIYMCKNKATIVDTINEYNCSRKQVYEALRRIKLRLPVLYNFIYNRLLLK